MQWRPQGAAGAASGGLESSWAQLFRSEGARREVLLAFLSEAVTELLVSEVPSSAHGT